MIGVYFSGTGNTQYCIEKLISIYDKNSPVFSIEENSVTEAIKQHQNIIFPALLDYQKNEYWSKQEILELLE